MRGLFGEYTLHTGTRELRRTVHRFGYAFCAEFGPLPALADASQRAFRLLWGNREIALLPGRNILSRCPESVAWIDDPSISRRHAMIEISDSNVFIRDVGSKNGTFVDGQRVADRHTLVDGDPITLGRVPMIFRAFLDGGPTTSAHSPP